MKFNNQKKVVIITISYNVPEYTIKCINSILTSTYDDFTILLIDNASEQINISKLKANLPNDKRINLILQDKNIGYVGGVNKGLAEGSKYNPEYFMIMNNDTIIAPSAINNLVETCYQYNNKAIVTGKVYNYNTNIIQYVGDQLIDENYLKYKRIGSGELDSGQFDHISERDMIDDIFWLFPKKLYDDIGGYSEYFWFNGESADFALRAKNKDYKMVFTPDAKLWHKGSISIGGRIKNPIKSFWIIQSKILLRKKHLTNFYFARFILKVFYETNPPLESKGSFVLYQIDDDSEFLTMTRAENGGWRIDVPKEIPVGL